MKTKYVIAAVAALSSVGAFAAGGEEGLSRSEVQEQVLSQTLEDRLAGFGEHGSRGSAVSAASNTTRVAVEHDAAAVGIGERLAGFGEHADTFPSAAGDHAKSRAEVRAELRRAVDAGQFDWRANS